MTEPIDPRAGIMPAFVVGSSPKGAQANARRVAVNSLYNTGVSSGQKGGGGPCRHTIGVSNPPTREKARSPVPPLRSARLSRPVPPNSPQLSGSPLPPTGRSLPADVFPIGASCKPQRHTAADIIGPLATTGFSFSSAGRSQEAASESNPDALVETTLGKSGSMQVSVQTQMNIGGLRHEAATTWPCASALSCPLGSDDLTSRCQSPRKATPALDIIESVQREGDKEMPTLADLPQDPAAIEHEEYTNQVRRDEQDSKYFLQERISQEQPRVCDHQRDLVKKNKFESGKMKIIRQLEEHLVGQMIGLSTSSEISAVTTAPPPTSAPTSTCGGASSCGAESLLTVRTPKLEPENRVHTSPLKSRSPLSFSFAEAQQADEKDGKSCPSATDMTVQLAQGLQLLNDALADIHKEKAQRETLSSSLRNLSRRLDEGLIKVGEVTTAHSDSEAATDAVLSAMRRCIDELSMHCAWPPPGHQDDHNYGKTLSAAVHHQIKQIQQLQQLHAQLEAQHEEQRQHMSSLSVIMQMQQQRMDEGVAAVTAAAATFPARLDTLSANVVSVQNRVTELAVAAAEKADTDAAIASQLHALQDKVLAQEQAMLSEKQQIVDLFKLVQLREPHLKTEVANSSLVETAAGLQQLKDEVTTIATALNVVLGRVNDLSEEDPSRAMRTEIGAIAYVVSQLSERVDRLGGQEVTPSNNFSQIVDSDAIVALEAPVASFPAAQHDAPPPTRQESHLEGLLNYLEKRADESKEYRIQSQATEPHIAQIEIATEPRIVPAFPFASAPQIVVTKAPSPRKWLEEPLSAAVGRRSQPSWSTAGHWRSFNTS